MDSELRRSRNCAGVVGAGCRVDILKTSSLGLVTNFTNLNNGAPICIPIYVIEFMIS